MEDEDLYDEFGNFIGGNSDDSSSESERDELVETLELLGTGEVDDLSEEDENDEDEDEDEDEDGDAVTDRKSLVVKDDAELNRNDVLVKAYGTAVETLVMSEDTPMTNEEPVIKPLTHKKMKVEFTDDVRSKNPLLEGEDLCKEMWRLLPELNYDREYMIQTMKLVPERIRTVAVVGGLHSGKTTFIDTLVLDTHSPSIQPSKTLKSFKPLRFTDNHKMEIERGMSIRLSPVTLLLPDLRGISYVLNLIDTPGHVAFEDESTAALQAVDGMVLVIDVVEGLTFRDRNLITEALRMDLAICVVLNKLDRLVLDLRLPPRDAYYKMEYIIDDINAFIDTKSEYLTTYSHPKQVTPLNGNVIFASSTLQLAFSIETFANLYYENMDLGGDDLDATSFQQYLWGDIFYDLSNKTFTTNQTVHPHSFVHFVLEPIYKLFTYTLVSDVKGLELSHYLWHEFGVEFPKANFKLDPPILLRNVFHSLFSFPKVFTQMVVRSTHVESESGSVSGSESESFIGKAVKLIESSNGQDFLALVRVIQGSISKGSRVRVLGETFAENDEDMAIQTVNELYIPGGRYKVPVNDAGVGSLILIGGIDSIINSGATLLDPVISIDAPTDAGTGTGTGHSTIFTIPDYTCKSVFKVAIEPANPSELPRFLDGLRKINKTYLASRLKVEASGEHVLMGPGELYLDCVLHDLRLFFTDDLEIKVSDPTAKFSETCSETSVVKIASSIGSTGNKISVIAEPNKDWKLSRAIEQGKLDLSQPVKHTAKVLRKEFGWDALAARSVWSFGPNNDLKSASMLLDDTLEENTDKVLLYSLKDSICTGFKWAVNEGPLCDEPIRNTKFKILDMALAGSVVQAAGGSAQLVPLVRKACYTGLLTAKPRLMEPIYTVHVTTSEPAIEAVSLLVSKRRGKIIHQNPIPGTALHQLEGFIPVIESAGLETDIRLRTQGQAMCFLEFRKWDIVPGDPLDLEAFIPKLKPAPKSSLARDFVMKTRRRKGLSGEPSLQKYVDPNIYLQLKERGLLL